MSKPNPVLRVKANLGNFDFSNIGDAKTFLFESCVGSHVSLVTWTNSGSQRVTFVHVVAPGVVRETYGAERAVDLDQLCAS